MTRNRLLLTAGVALIAIAAPIAWWLISPLFITRTVNEDFPIVAAAPAEITATVGDMVDDEMMAELTATADREMVDDQPSPTTQSMSEPTAAPTAEPTVPPTAVPAVPRLLLSGEFHAVDHPGMGTASIYELPDGSRTLRLENFATDNGPDLFVWLSSAPDANDAATILNSQYVSLGRLKGNQGNQNYALPADLDLADVGSVTIWCRQFSVNFTTARLRVSR